ncbi:MAG: hypothetical protein HWD92_06755 [Flavobacteriia bacterium]|nr:hypothetical protein [Flavobacteriia bacterium]
MRKLLPIILVIAVVGFIIGYRMYNKPHTDVANTEPVYTGDVAGLKDVLNKGQAEFDSLYADQVIVVSGNITNVGEKSVVLDHILYCEPDSTAEMTAFERGAEITIRGEVEGSEEDLIEGFIIRVGRVIPENQ